MRVTDFNTPVVVRVGQTLAVKPPTPNVDWQVDYDAESLRLVTPEADVATPGRRGWVWRAARVGESELVLTSRTRCSTPSCEPSVMRFTVRFDIKPEGIVPRTEGPQAAASRRHMLMADESGTIAVGGLMRAKAEVADLRAAQLRLDPEMASVAGISRQGWTWLGPGNKGGRVRAVAVHPTTTSTIFIGSVAGGIWKTTNSGGTWAPVDDFMTNLAVTTLVFQPGNPSVMYAGTGEGFFNFDRIRGAGIFTSVDAGVTWSQLASTANGNFYYVNRLSMSADGQTILAATSVGLYRSTNAGATWTNFYQPLNTTRKDVVDVKFLPGSSLNAVASGFATNAYFTSDAGLSWTPASGMGPTGTFNRVEIGVAPATPATVYLSVDHLSQQSGSGQIWKSTDSGQSYALVRTTGHLSAQGWYDNAIWVDPTNSDRVVAAGVNAYRSTDGFATNQTTLSGIHTDFHLFVSDPGYNGTTNKRIYVGNDGGVFKNDDITTGSTFVSLNNNLGITQFYGAGGNTTSGKIIGGTQDNSTVIYWPANGANAWSTPFGGDGGYSAADPNDVNYLYGEVQYGYVHRNTTGGSSSSRYIFGYSNTLGTCKAAPYCLSDAWNKTINFIPPLVLDPNNANRMLVGGRSLWRSNDVKAAGDQTTGEGTGPQWAVIKPPTTGNSNINTIGVAPGNSDIVWVGHNNGDVYVTTDGTVANPTWTKVDGNAVALPGRAATRVVVDPGNSSIAYVSFGGFNSNSVWRTTDIGASWSQVTGSGATALVTAPVYALAIHPTNTTWIYAGTEVGIFASTDSGATWAVPHDGPANVSVDELFWMGTNLVAVTHGRGLFVASTGGAFGKLSPADNATGQSTNPTLSWTASAGATSYEYCYDTINNDACDASWLPTGTNTSVGVGGLTAGATYYWQVRANGAGTTYANGNATAFWSFATVPPAPPGVFGKTSPANGATGQPVNPVLTWSVSAGATSYEYCYDTSNDSACNATWVSTGTSTSTSVALSGLAPGTSHYWHVRAMNGNGTTYADGSACAFRVFTTAVPTMPFGVVDTPTQNAAGVQGAIGVTGWALDDTGVNTVQIYRNCLAFEPGNCQTILGNSVVYIGNAAFLDGARPDVAAMFPTYPNNTRAGWGYLMLTPVLPHVPNSLPSGGQGPLTLYAIATDAVGNQTLLGRSFDPNSPAFATPTAITMANDTIAKPFGAIDTPGQGETISGVFANFGWAITPDTNTIADGTDILIPTNGSSMTVYVDGLAVSLVAYNQCRGTVGNPVPAGVYCNDDVSNIFGNATPQAPLALRTSNPTRFRNLDAARAPIGAYTFNTALLADGLHTIAWSVTDSAGRNEGIGSRFFNVLNGGPDAHKDAALRAAPARVVGFAAVLDWHAPASDGVWSRTGFNLATPWTAMHVNEGGTFVVRLPELGRLELWLGAPVDAGYLVVGDTLRPLPVGSSIVGPQFGWMPPPGYTGAYTLAFIRGGERITVTVRIGAM